MNNVTVPVNDSLRIRFRVRGEDGLYLSLAGFTVTAVVKAANTQASPPLLTVAGVLQTPDTSSLAIIAPDQLATVGKFYVTVRGLDPDESYSETFSITVIDHA
jgi:hypothetical protein